jgi:hypothetical protein
MLDNPKGRPMTQKDYVAIAAALASTRPSYEEVDPQYREMALIRQAQQLQWEHVCRVVGDVCATDNPRFNRIRFVQACMAVSGGN